MYRQIIWTSLISNTVKINKSLYRELLNMAILMLNPEASIVCDLDRTLVHLLKIPDFARILTEAYLLLHMFMVPL